MQTIQSLIEDAFERRNDLTQADIDTHLRPAVEQVIELLESGERRVAEPVDEYDQRMIDRRESEPRGAARERVEAGGQHLCQAEPVRPAGGESGRR